MPVGLLPVYLGHYPTRTSGLLDHDNFLYRGNHFLCVMQESYYAMDVEANRVCGNLGSTRALNCCIYR